MSKIDIALCAQASELVVIAGDRKPHAGRHCLQCQHRRSSLAFVCDQLPRRLSYVSILLQLKQIPDIQLQFYSLDEQGKADMLFSINLYRPAAMIAARP